jgi:sugar phosphate permease
MGLALTVLGVVVAAASLVGRFRRARGIERQQLRWVALAAGVVSLAAALVLAAMLTETPALYGWGSLSARRSCRWESARRSCATGCMTWT